MLTICGLSQCDEKYQKFATVYVSLLRYPITNMPTRYFCNQHFYKHREPQILSKLKDYLKQKKSKDHPHISLSFFILSFSMSYSIKYARVLLRVNLYLIITPVSLGNKMIWLVALSSPFIGNKAADLFTIYRNLQKVIGSGPFQP